MTRPRLGLADPHFSSTECILVSSGTVTRETHATRSCSLEVAFPRTNRDISKWTRRNERTKCQVYFWFEATNVQHLFRAGPFIPSMSPGPLFSWTTNEFPDGLKRTLVKWPAATLGRDHNRDFLSHNTSCCQREKARSRVLFLGYEVPSPERWDLGKAFSLIRDRGVKTSWKDIVPARH